MALKDLYKNLGIQASQNNNGSWTANNAQIQKREQQAIPTLNRTSATTTQTVIRPSSPVAQTSQVKTIGNTSQPVQTFSTTIPSVGDTQINNTQKFSNASTFFKTPTEYQNMATKSTHGGTSGKWVSKSDLDKLRNNFGQGAVDEYQAQLKRDNIINQYESTPKYNIFEQLFDPSKRAAVQNRNSIAEEYQSAKDEEIAKMLAQRGISTSDLMTTNASKTDLVGMPTRSFDMKKIKELGLNKSDEKYLADYVSRQIASENNALQTALAENSNGLQKTISSINSVPQNAIGSATNLIGKTADYVTGNSIMKDSAEAQYGNMAQNVRGAVSKDFNGVGNFLYGAGMSMADMGIAATTGGFAPIVMGAEKASSTMNDAVDRGLTSNQVMAEGIISGVTTALTEKVPFDKILSGGVGKSALKNILGASISEGGQEIAEDILDSIADKIIAGDKSELSMQFNNLTANGMSEDEALDNIIKGYAKQVALDGLAGAVSGGALAGLNVGANALNNIGTNVNENGTTNGTINATEIATENEIPTVNAVPKSILDEQNASRRTVDVLESGLPKAEANIEQPTKHKMSMKGVLDARTNTNVNENVSENVTNDIKSEVNPAEEQKIDPNLQFFGGENSTENVTEPTTLSKKATERMVERRSDKLFALDDMKREAETKVVDAIETSKFIEEGKKKQFVGQLKNAINSIISSEKLNTVSDFNEVNKAYNDAKSKINQIAKDLGAEGKVACNEALQTLDNAYKETLKLTGYDTEGNKLVQDKTLNTIAKSGLLSDEELAEIDAEDFTHKKVSMKELHENAAVKNVDDVVNRISKAKSLNEQDVIDVQHAVEKIEDTATKIDTLKKVSKEISKDATKMRAWQEYSKGKPESLFVEFESKVRKSVDKKHYDGYTYTVEEIANAVKKAIEGSGSIEEVKQKIKFNLQFFAETSGITSAKEMRTARNADELIARLESMIDKLDSKSAKKGNTDTTTPNGLTVDKKNELQKQALELITDKFGVALLSSEEEVQLFNLLKEAEQFGDKNSRSYKELMGQAGKIIGSHIKSSAGNKLKTVLYDNMLFSAKTMITRNLGGNAINLGLDALERPIATAIDYLTSTKTGKHTMMMSNKDLATYTKGFIKGAKDQTLDIKSGISTTRSGENTVNAYTDANTKTFNTKNPVGKAFNAYDALVKNTMSYGDRTFYEGAYALRKGELQNIYQQYGESALEFNPKTMPKSVKDNVDLLIDYLARESALEACMQNNGAFASGINKLKHGIGDISTAMIGADVATQGVMPFTQVAANLAERTIDHVPVAGAVKAISLFAQGKIDQRNFSTSMARNVVGSLLTLGAYAMAANGMATGAYSDDSDEKKAQQSNGYQEYALKCGDILVDLSQTGVPGAIFEMGATAKDSVDKGNGVIPTIAKASGQGIRSLLDDQVFSGITQLGEVVGTVSSSFSGDTSEANLQKLLGTYAMQFIPSIVRNVASMDEYKRDLGKYGTVEYQVNTFKNAIPTLKSGLDKKVDNEGNYVKNTLPKALRIANALVLPFNITKEQYSELTNEAMKLSEEGLKQGFAPVTSRSDVQKAYEKANKEFNSHEYNSFNKRRGELNSKIGTEIINSDYYKSASADVKAELLSEAFKAANAITKYEITDGYGSAENKHDVNGLSNKAAQAYINGSLKDAISTLVNKREDKDFKEEYGIEKSATVNRLIGSGLSEDKAAEFKKAATVDGHIDKQAALDFVKSNNIPKLEAGKMYYNATSNPSQKAQKAYDTKGYEGVAMYYETSAYADADGNGSVKKDEFKAYANSVGMDKDTYNWYYHDIFGWKK